MTLRCINIIKYYSPRNFIPCGLREANLFLSASLNTNHVFLLKRRGWWCRSGERKKVRQVCKTPLMGGALCVVLSCRATQLSLLLCVPAEQQWVVRILRRVQAERESNVENMKLSNSCRQTNFSLYIKNCARQSVSNRTEFSLKWLEYN